MSRHLSLIGALLLLTCCNQPQEYQVNIDNVASTINNSVMTQCDTHAEMERSLKADGYRLAERRPGIDVYRLVRVIGVTGAGAEDEQIVRRSGSRDCIDIEQSNDIEENR
jgi:hypothetical protein